MSDRVKQALKGRKARFKQPKYEDGRTKQAFKDECDIHKIIARASKVGTLSHLERHGAFYADFSGFDFTEAQLTLARGKTIFEQLPAEVRREFKHDPAQFFEFVNAPENVDRLHEVLPALARPGTQLPTVNAGKPVSPAKPEGPEAPIARSAEATEGSGNPAEAEVSG